LNEAQRVTELISERKINGDNTALQKSRKNPLSRRGSFQKKKTFGKNGFARQARRRCGFEVGPSPAVVLVTLDEGSDNRPSINQYGSRHNLKDDSYSKTGPKEDSRHQ
jgi:hypothetical protein